MRQRLIILFVLMGVMTVKVSGQTAVNGAFPSWNNERHDALRSQQYYPGMDGSFICENGINRFTRALYGGPTDYRIETSDRPVFAIVKKGHHRHVSFRADGIALDSTAYCRSFYKNGMRLYEIGFATAHPQTEGNIKPVLRCEVVALQKEEGAVWRFSLIHDSSKEGDCSQGKSMPEISVRLCEIAQPRLHRNGDIGVDAPGAFEADPQLKGLTEHEAITDNDGQVAYVVVRMDRFVATTADEAARLFAEAADYMTRLGSRVKFFTPEPYINTLGSALCVAADGDWDGETWLHGCVGWRMPLAGWRAAYAGDVLGWHDRARSHFNAYANSQVTNVEPTLPHPTQDSAMHLARAEKRWGTQMYSNGYICRNPKRNDQMHHYDMNLNYIDELLWHFQYDADTAYMRKMWPVLQRHLTWEKRNFDPDGDHLYDAYCCIWASDALYYSGGAVTHSSAYNYRANLLTARIAELIGENPKPYADEAQAILKAMNRTLWLKDNTRHTSPYSHVNYKPKGHWAEYKDGMGLKRIHDHPALWSIYTPIDCGACSPSQARQAIDYAMDHYATFSVKNSKGHTIATSDWMPYSWSINNVAAAETMHAALACFEAGRVDDGYHLLLGNVEDQMYFGQSPANFGQLSQFDAARGECYRDFGDCIGIASRTLIQGLFGIVPNALYGECVIRPSFPVEWDTCAVQTPYLSYTFSRKSGNDIYHIKQNFSRPLKIVYRGVTYNGHDIEVEGTTDSVQTITVPTDWSSRYSLTYDVITPEMAEYFEQERKQTEQERTNRLTNLGLDEPDSSLKNRRVKMEKYFNAEVDDIFRNKYLSPRPQTTTLQIPVQGVGEWCHPQYTPEINDSVFRTLIGSDGTFSVAGIPFATPQRGKNIVYTSLFDNYPDSVTIPLKGHASAACLMMAGSTNHMQCHISNGQVSVTYTDGTSTVMPLINPYNWCPIEQDFYVDGKAFTTLELRPYRVCLATGAVSRDLGRQLGIKGVDGRQIPGGAAQMLRMPLNPDKKLKSLTLRTLSNDVVIGLMAVTLQE